MSESFPSQPATPAAANTAQADGDWRFINDLENLGEIPDTLSKSERIYIGGMYRTETSVDDLRQYSVPAAGGKTKTIEVAPTGVTLEIGGESGFATVEVVDTRPVFARAQDTKEPVLPGRASGFGIIVRNQAGEPVAFESLWRDLDPEKEDGQAVIVGRNTVPGLHDHDTVSREHVGLSMAKDGTLTIQNLEPTNETRLFKRPVNEVTGPDETEPHIFEGQAGGAPLSATESAIAGKAIANQIAQVRHAKEGGATPVEIGRETAHSRAMGR